MKIRGIPRKSWAYFASITWVLFTSSLVSWWWVFGLKQLDLYSSFLSDERLNASKRMMLFEGAVLVLAVITGGMAIIILVHREKKRHDQLHLFFSNFAHDLNTAMARLRLQCEVLHEDQNDKHTKNILESLHRLNLQLENSLTLAREEKKAFLKEKFLLSDLIGSVRLDYPELDVRIQKDVEFKADASAMRSVVHNLIQNSVIHGEATQVNIQANELIPGRIRISVQDNGKGFVGTDNQAAQFGKNILHEKPKHGNGLGLYLSSKIVQRMNGHLAVPRTKGGFSVSIDLPGSFV